jgi:hypothetical protein
MLNIQLCHRITHDFFIGSLEFLKALQELPRFLNKIATTSHATAQWTKNLNSLMHSKDLVPFYYKNVSVIQKN